MGLHLSISYDIGIRAKSLRREVTSILSFKQIVNIKGRNGMPKKKMPNKRMQIKPTLNATIALSVNCYCQENQEKCLAQYYFYFECTFKKSDYLCLNEIIF